MIRLPARTDLDIAIDRAWWHLVTAATLASRMLWARRLVDLRREREQGRA